LRLQKRKAQEARETSLKEETAGKEGGRGRESAKAGWPVPTPGIHMAIETDKERIQTTRDDCRLRLPAIGRLGTQEHKKLIRPLLVAAPPRWRGYHPGTGRRLFVGWLLDTNQHRAMRAIEV
jgi:hypothetical protein